MSQAQLATLVGAARGVGEWAAADDSIACYDAVAARDATVVVPPTKTATVSPRRPRSKDRDRTIKKVTAIGRHRRKQEAGYQQKSIIGHGLCARSPGGPVAEALLAGNVLNQMAELGRPASYGIRR